VTNAHFEAREWGEDVIFLRRLASGAASRSYGIQVARLAGLPESIIERAREILANLEGGELDERGRPRIAGPASGDEPSGDQLGLFQVAAVDRESKRGEVGKVGEALELLRRAEPEQTTPLEALELLTRVVSMVRDEVES
jgi:DNA mismatch repair protein MutS